jgi:hypothetical protein
MSKVKRVEVKVLSPDFGDFGTRSKRGQGISGREKNERSQRESQKGGSEASHKEFQGQRQSITKITENQ